MAPNVETVLIVGAGWVGRQLAARIAQAGIQVRLSDREEAVCTQAIDWLKRVASDQAGGPQESAPDDWLDRVHIAPVTKDLTAANASLSQLNIDLVIESIPEQLSLKKRVLKQLSTAFPSPVMIASNSSYFVPSLLAPYVTEPSRFAHIHFHVPVLHDSVVDIVGCETTASETTDSLVAFSQRLRLEPLLLRREHPGYVFNWMLQALLKSALELAALDVVDIEDIDKSWRAVTGMPLGPFGIMDQIGLDVIEQVLANARWAGPSTVSSDMLLGIIQAKVAEGKLGTKTLEGFYQYDQDSRLH